MTDHTQRRRGPRTWGQHIKLLLSPKGAPSFALWSLLTGVQVGIVAYLLTGASTHSVIHSVYLSRLPQEVIAALVAAILLLSVVRGTLLTPIATVLMRDKHVGVARALSLAWSRAGRVTGAVFITSLFTMLGSAVAVMLDVSITSFVELPCLVAVCLLPFLVASGKDMVPALWGALRTSRKAWPLLLMLFVMLHILGSGIELSTFGTLPKSARLFSALFALEMFSLVTSVSLYATVIKKYRCVEFEDLDEV